jgi:hypothetical protein
MRFIVPDFHQDGKLTLDAYLPGMYDVVIQSTHVNIIPVTTGCKNDTQ